MASVISFIIRYVTVRQVILNIAEADFKLKSVHRYTPTAIDYKKQTLVFDYLSFEMLVSTMY